MAAHLDPRNTPKGKRSAWFGNLSRIHLLVAAGDEEKAGLLRRLVPGAAERLRLFDADLFDAATFAPAIAGCQFVFLVATPFGLENAGSKVKFAIALPFILLLVKE